MEDIQTDSNQFWVVGKGRKLRAVFMTKKALEYLRAWLEKRPSNSEFVFVALPSRNKQDIGLTRNTIEDIVRHYAKLTGITKKVTPHTLRHSFATSLIKK